jgi:hypothetical protein
MPFSPPFIISASRRTDIPAFYGRWFRNRLAAGWCETANPFSGQVYRVSLEQGDVLGWVFWSRNYRPFLETLRELHTRGHRFLLHFTITGYPRILEPRTIEADAAIQTARELASAFGPDTVIWRYDPILLSSLTPPEWHLENFERMSARLEGATRRCIFSFPTMYQKTKRNLGAASAKDSSFRVWSIREGDFSVDDLHALAQGLAAKARGHGMSFSSCCGDRWVDPDAGIGRASCVDWPLLRNLLREARSKGKLPPEAPDPDAVEVPANPSRKECGCWRSVDIGRYETCAQGYVYCYAVDRAERAVEYLKAHNPDAPGL